MFVLVPTVENMKFPMASYLRARGDKSYLGDNWRTAGSKFTVTVTAKLCKISSIHLELALNATQLAFASITDQRQSNNAPTTPRRRVHKPQIMAPPLVICALSISCVVGLGLAPPPRTQSTSIRWHGTMHRHRRWTGFASDRKSTRLNSSHAT